MIRVSLIAMMMGSTAAAEVAVVTDIAPVAALVNEIAGTGVEPLIGPGASPHDFAMRPSDARRLSGADLVIWVGEGLTPWLEEPIAELAGSAQRLTLMETPGWEVLPIEAPQADKAAHDDGDGHDDHADEHGHDDDHGHGDHADEHGHDDHADGHDDHADGHDDHTDGDDDHADGGDHHGHDHGAFDPHAWLDPAVLQVWADEISTALAEADPAGAAGYRMRAEALQDALGGRDAALRATLTGLGPVILPHDGYQYFTARYDIPVAGHVTATDDTPPGPARLAALRDAVQSGDVACVLHGPGPTPGWLATLTDGTDVKTGEIDNLGGPDVLETLDRLGAAFAVCAAG